MVYFPYRTWRGGVSKRFRIFWGQVPRQRNFRGDASQTIRALPLAAAFSMEVLSDHADMQKEIASLTALYAVVLAWLACKRGDVPQVQTNCLRDRQKKTHQKFCGGIWLANLPTKVTLQHAHPRSSGQKATLFGCVCV